jgi:transglutaminase-like putative cysteine protease
MADQASFANHSPFTDPVAWTSRLDEVPGDLVSIRDAARGLVYHFWAGDFAENGIAPERLAEIDTRYADAMFDRLFSLADLPLTSERPPAQRLVGCCRDYTVLFLSIARHHGIPARARVGFATYLIPGWNIDHEIVEAWDSEGERWRRIDVQLPEGYVNPDDGTELASLDVPADRFIDASRAWLAARSGKADPEKFLVSPDLEVPGTRGWPYIVHNLVDELAALNKREMLRWDSWGIAEGADQLTAERREALDRLAEAIVSPETSLEELASLYERPDYRVPKEFTSFSPAEAAPLRVKLRSGV